MKHTSEKHEEGLHHDLPRLLQTGLSRRNWIQLAGATGVSMLLPGCSGWDAPTRIATDASGRVCTEAASETAGPYPSDGSNRINGSVSNTLADAGVVRSDINSSFGSSARVATGTPMTLTVQLVNVNSGCAPLANHAVYVWHCDAGGLYSLYSDGALEDNYLRGVQVSDANGELSFRTIVPGCYRGRFPHIHFEVFASLDDISDHRQLIQSSQMALPRDVCAAAYSANDSYANSIDNFSRMTLENDSVFNDNTAEQLKAMTILITGEPLTGFTGHIEIGVAA